MMDWSAPDGVLSRLLSGDPIAILVALLVVISLPILVHSFLYQASSKPSQTPAFLLLGRSGSGKTQLFTLVCVPNLYHVGFRLTHLQLHRRSSTDPTSLPALSPSIQTRTTQISTTLSLLLPSTIPRSSNGYRSAADLAAHPPNAAPYELIDTPGHGKLRAFHSLPHIENRSLRGIIFVVDAADFDNDESTRDTADFLYDALFTLQERRTKNGKQTMGGKGVKVLVAANKQDLFTALPAGAVRARLEAEIEKVRLSRRKRLASMVHEEDEDTDPDDARKFTFERLKEERQIELDVLGGACRGEEAEGGKGVRLWEEWLGSCL
jgi:signal recognition particle receptor subunit beta